MLSFTDIDSEGHVGAVAVAHEKITLSKKD
jgi:hypothetical protein